MELNEIIKKDIADNKVLIYMKGDRTLPQCGFSSAVVKVFTQLGVPFETRDVISDPELREGIKKFSNWPTIPQVYVKGEFIGGCDITLEMFKNGELQKLLDSQ